MAIDRKTIVARIMDGAATPAYQFLPDGMFGTLPKAPELKYDPQAAKKLLAEAGYPDGFERDAGRHQRPLHQRRPRSRRPWRSTSRASASAPPWTP